MRRAQARGHSVTLFNRGRTNPHLFPDVEKLVGDRDGGLDVLRGGSWDAVIDASGYIPRVVRDSAELLRETVHRYLFISTGDVYADFEEIGLDEDYTLDTMEDPTIEDPGRFYGPLKVLCERAVGPASPLTMAELLYGIRAVTDSSVDFTWVPADFLRSMDVAAMTDLPIWFPPLDDYPTPAPFEPGAKGFHQMSGARAITAGLSFRPLAETARDVIDEYLSRDEDWSSTPRRFGLSLDREAEVLAALRVSGR